MEPGGDATYNVALVANSGFWSSFNSYAAPSMATDFVHGSHAKSILSKSSSGAYVATQPGVVSGTGGRVSGWFYLNAMPTANAGVLMTEGSNNNSPVIGVLVTSGGVLKARTGATTLLTGGTGATITTGTWYRISMVFTVTSTTVYSLNVYLNGVLTISITNSTALSNASPSVVRFGDDVGSAAIDMRVSDCYVDNGTSLTDPGNIWIAVKRPNANGTTNGFTTQVGAGGSGYGTGHSPQVNERAASQTNGWSVVGAGSAVTEEYNIEGLSVGDTNLTGATIVDVLAWATCKAVLAETVQLILAGVQTGFALVANTVSLIMIGQGSATFPPGTGADVGMVTSTTATTVSLFECGILIAYIPAPPPDTSSYFHPIEQPTNHYIEGRLPILA